MSDETRGSDAAAPGGGDARDDYTSERDSAVRTARKRRRAEGESEEGDGGGALYWHRAVRRGRLQG